MTAIPQLDSEEAYLAAILDDPSGIELAEFIFVDEEKEDRCFRVWDYQWPWWSNEDTFQIDQCGRSLGKTQGIIIRAFAFPFNFPGQEMLITAPELNHLRPVTDKVENLFLSTRLGREMLPKVKGGGINHQPQFQARFINGSRIISRLPNRDGRGVKGCCEEGTLVLTRRGQVPVEDVVVGDEVWTHQGRWKPVVETYAYADVDGFEINGGGHRGLRVSDNHRMYVRRNRTPQGRRTLTAPDFEIVDETAGAYFGSPTRFAGVDQPEWITSELAWVVGRYVADGHLQWALKNGRRTSGRVVLTINEFDVSDVVSHLEKAGLRPSATARKHNRSWSVEASDTALARNILEHFGQHAESKTLPSWLLCADVNVRSQFLEGYLAGDGHWDDHRSRWMASTASKALAVGVRLLGQTLGYAASFSWVDPKVTAIAGRELLAPARRSYRVTLSRRGTAVVEQHVAWRNVRSVQPVTGMTVYDIQVADDHSYVADGLISHNQHPLVLEADEMQDFPAAGWTELIETMKAGSEGAQWRCHGVSRGVRDTYYRMTMGDNPDLPFKVHRYMAPHRPTWSDAERKSKIAIYGGTEDNVDYRRNIFGEHGDAHSPLFVLARLMSCVRINESSWATEYNDDIYARIKVNDELHRKTKLPIESFVDLPASHLEEQYLSFWGGADIGYTNDPTEILIWGVVKRRGQPDLLRQLTRIQLQRISAQDQADVIRQVFRFYGLRLKRFGLDKTGNGLPLWQMLRDDATIGSRIVGYGFSEKKPVEFDDREPTGRETMKDLVIEKNVIDFATDELRRLVDTGALELPYDVELLSEFQGQSVQVVKDMGSAGDVRRRYSGGSAHTLDAARMLVAAKTLEAIEKTLAAPQRQGPVLDQFFG